MFTSVRLLRRVNIFLRGGLVLLAISGSPAFAEVINFSDLTLAPGTFYNGGPTTNTAGWTSEGVFFGNSFNSEYGGYWNGFSCSRVNNTIDGGYTNQYAAFTGTGYLDSTYAVGYSGSQAFINLPTGYAPESVRVTNTTYAARDMMTGSMFSSPFTSGDYLTVTFTGYSQAGATGSATGNTTFYLGNFLAGNTLIVSTWEPVDLTSLGSPVSIGLSWDSTDSGTPTYVALDNLTIAPVPEPGTWALGAGAVVASWGLRRRWARKS